MKIVLLLLVAQLAACSEKEAAKVSLPAEAAASEAAPSTPEKVVAPSEIARRLNGAFEARRTAGISAKVSGAIRAVLVEEGDHVAEGDKLIEMDASAFRLQLEQAEASIGVAKSQIHSIQIEVDRSKRLLAKNAIAPSQVEQLDGQLETANAQLQAASVSAKMARRSISESVIRAPFSGIVTGVTVAIGEYASAGPAALLTLVEEDVLLRLRAPEEYLSTFKVGGELTARVPSQNRDVKLRVERVNPIVSARSRTFDVLAAPLEPDTMLRPGMFAEVNVEPVSAQ